MKKKDIEQQIDWMQSRIDYIAGCIEKGVMTDVLARVENLALDLEEVARRQIETSGHFLAVAQRLEKRGTGIGRPISRRASRNLMADAYRNAVSDYRAWAG